MALRACAGRILRPTIVGHVGKCGALLRLSAARPILPRTKTLEIRTPRILALNGLRIRPYSTPTTPEQKPAPEKEKPSSKLTTAIKHENIYTIPNILTVARIVATPFIGYAVLNGQYALATGAFVAAGITDMIDGWIARKWNLQTVVGSVIDPAADKFLMTVMTTTLAVQGLLPVWLAVIILGRDVALSISAFYFRWISLPPPKTMSRYWDFSLPSAEVRPTQISKINTALQIGLLAASTAHPLVTGMDLDLYLAGFQYLVATTTVWSGLSYVFSKNAVRFVHKQDKRGKGTKA